MNNKAQKQNGVNPLLVGLLIIVVFIALILWGLFRPSPAPVPPPATQTPLPSATPTEMVALPSPVATQTPTVTPSPTGAPSATPTAQPSPTDTPAVTPSATTTPEPERLGGDFYEIKPGDSFWSIAEATYGDPLLMVGELPIYLYLCEVNEMTHKCDLLHAGNPLWLVLMEIR